MIRVSDFIARHLDEIGVRAAFLLSGGGMMHLIDAVSRVDNIRVICNHHEQACAMAAEGYARVTGQLGVCYATSGPGATNILTGLVGSWQDSVPVLFLTGQSKVSQTIQNSGIAGLRQFGTFEVDIVPIVQSVTKYAVLVNDPKSIRYHLEKAIYRAMTGRPGPVLLDVPLDVQAAPIDPDELAGFDPRTDDADSSFLVPAVQAKDVETTRDLLLCASRPLILAGHGVRTAHARADFLRLIEELNVPVVTTQLAKDLLPYDHPLFVGHCGPRGDRAGNFAVQNADVIVSVGCSLHVMTTGYELDEFATQAVKVLVDPDAAVLAREQVGVSHKIQADVGEFVRALNKAMDAMPKLGGLSDWRQKTEWWKTHLPVINEPHKNNVDEPSNYYQIIHVLSGLMQSDDYFVNDAGLSFYVVGQTFRAKNNTRVITSGAMGAMGYTLAASIGMAVGRASQNDKNSRIIALTGDGSFQLNIHELATIRHNNLPIKLFVINNGGYLSIRNTQKGFFSGHAVGSGEDSGVWCPPTEKIAAAYDLPYLACHTRADLEATIEQALSTDGPVLCEIFADLQQPLMPSVPSFKLEDGSMKSKMLHEMAPPLPDDVLREALQGLPAAPQSAVSKG